MKVVTEAFSETPIEWHLHKGRSHAVSRKSLATMTGLSDRQVRDMIEQARANGALICNDQDGHGYYLAETYDEIQRQYSRDYARAISLLVRLKPFREALTVMEGQLGIDQY